MPAPILWGRRVGAWVCSFLNIDIFVVTNGENQSFSSIAQGCVSRFSTTCKRFLLSAQRLPGGSWRWLISVWRSNRRPIYDIGHIIFFWLKLALLQPQSRYSQVPTIMRSNSPFYWYIYALAYYPNSTNFIVRFRSYFWSLRRNHFAENLENTRHILPFAESFR